MMKRLGLIIVTAAAAFAQSKAQSTDIHVLPVQGNIYMLVGAGGNIAASIGQDGILLVDAGTAQMSSKVLSTVLQLVTAVAASPTPNRCVGLHCARQPVSLVEPVPERDHRIAGAAQANPLHHQHQHRSGSHRRQRGTVRAARRFEDPRRDISAGRCGADRDGNRPRKRPRPDERGDQRQANGRLRLVADGYLSRDIL